MSLPKKGVENLVHSEKYVERAIHNICYLALQAKFMSMARTFRLTNASIFR
jgi:hypothetical protein